MSIFHIFRAGRHERQSIDKMKLWGTGADVGDEVWAGIMVSQEQALRLSVVWRCIRVISESIASMPADAVRKRGDIREPVPDQPSWLQNPNPETSWFEFHERVCESLLMDGNAFVLITSRSALGFPSEFWTLHPQQIAVKKDASGRTFFVWNGQQVLSRYGPTNPTGDVLHIRLATAGGLRGLSPLEQARQAIGLGLAEEKYGARFFGRGTTMAGVIQLPASSPAQSRDYIDLMRETWEARHSGTDQAHRPGILTGGATWQGITIPNDQAQFLESRKFQVEEIAARIYGVPAHMVGLEEKNTSWGTGIEAQATGFVRFTLLPHIVRLESAFSSLLPRGQFVRLNTRSLLRADSETESKVLATELQNGVINFNYWRALKDLPPRPGGDSYVLPANFQVLPGGGVPAPAPPPAVPSSPNGNGQAVGVSP